MRDLLIPLLGVIWMLLILIAALQALILIADCLNRIARSLMDFCLIIWDVWHNASYTESDYQEY